jgi:hypothetical protein
MKTMDELKEDHLYDLKSEAKISIAEARAMIELAKENTLACTIKISGLTIGLCNNSKIIPALEHHIQEAEKCLNGLPNEYE